MIRYLQRTNIRAMPAKTGDILHTAAVGETGVILNDTPVFADSLYWYHVQVGSIAGWSVRQLGTSILFESIESTPQLSDYTDPQLLALMLAAEAGNQPLAAKVAVACVPLERLLRQRPHFGMSLRSVLLKPYQFSTFNDDHWRGFTDNIAENLMLAELSIAFLLKSPVRGATHYCRYDLTPLPPWTQPQYTASLGRVGDHLFYSEF